MSDAQNLLALSPIAHNAAQHRWRTEAMRSYASPRLITIAKGQGRITVAGLTSGYGTNNLIFIPAGTMFGMEVGGTVYGQMLTVPPAMASEWPDEHVHLRLRDVVAQKDLSLHLDALERELKSTAPSASRAAHYHTGLLSVYFERQIATHAGTNTDLRHQGTAARLVAAYTDLIERDFRTRAGVADYAAALGVTPTHLTRCCKQTCARSALMLLNDRILYESCRALSDTTQPVCDIATGLGFASAAYFTRSFQNRMGVTPSQFRSARPVAR